MTQHLEDSDADGRTVTDAEVREEAARSRRSVRFILVVVGVCIAVGIGLAFWVGSVGYDVSVPLGNGPSVACSSKVEAEGIAATVWREACHDAVDEARSRRRNQAALLGVGAFVVATAVSTWPSRRLTGERLGPLDR